MPVVNVREMRMVVRQRLVLMRVAVGFAAIPTGLMRVLVVRIVAMPVTMRKRRVLVIVGVVFRQVQPDTDRHQPRRQPKSRTGRLAQPANRQRSPDKRCR